METDIRVCKSCQKLRKRVFAGRYRGKDKRFVDENGLLWNGSVCGLCNIARVRNHMAKLRQERKLKREQALAAAITNTDIK